MAVTSDPTFLDSHAASARSSRRAVARVQLGGRQSVLEPVAARSIGLAASPAARARTSCRDNNPHPAPCQDTGQQVGRDECRPPALNLPDVGLLVVAAELQAPAVAADDHVAQVIAEKPHLSANQRAKPP